MPLATKREFITIVNIITTPKKIEPKCPEYYFSARPEYPTFHEMG